jgi:hypothetical protein
MRMKLLVVLGTTLAAAVLVPTAVADKTFHTLHAELRPVGDSPLRSGFVNDVHTNGVVNAAHEIYHLSGASPNTSYQFSILVYLLDPTCSSAPIVIPTAELTTNGAGNGDARSTFPAGPASPVVAEHGIRWVVAGTDGTGYETGCNVLMLD